MFASFFGVNSRSAWRFQLSAGTFGPQAVEREQDLTPATCVLCNFRTGHREHRKIHLNLIPLEEILNEEITLYED
ncbi:MAG TPA: hypothetical protein VF447_00685 [Terriglobales bacterium]